MSMPCRTGSPAMKVPTTLPSAGQRQATSPAVATASAAAAVGAAIGFAGGETDGAADAEAAVEFGAGVAAAVAGAFAMGSNGPGFVVAGGPCPGTADGGEMDAADEAVGAGVAATACF